MRFSTLARRCIGSAIAGSLLIAGAFAHAAAPIPVRVGVSADAGGVGFFIADKKGYFKEEGLAVSFVSFDSAAKMIAPLGAGQLEVGAGSPSAGLYNAVTRGIQIKIVADKGSTPPGFGFQPLLVRKDLVDSGRYKSLKDLKGMKIAGSAPGSGSTSTLNEALKKGGLKYSDVEQVFMAFPEHVAALQNKAVDAAMTTEPSATKAVQSGAAVRVMGDDEIYPNHQLSVVLYSSDFIKNNPDAAKRFMRAYLRATRVYNDALKGGHLAGPGAEDVISILTEYTNVKDPAVYRAISLQYCNPDGTVYIPSLKNDLAFFKEQGEVKGNVTVDDVLDTSFATAAVKELGVYKKK
jgi:NitT/TauT family transport system substrate-binding protein